MSALEGATQILEGCGFQTEQKQSPDGNTEEFWVLPEELIDVEKLQDLMKALETSEPVAVQLFRDPLVLSPPEERSREEPQLPADFFRPPDQQASYLSPLLRIKSCQL